MTTDVPVDAQSDVAVQQDVADTDDDNAKEPQNALTSKFTAEEWKAVKEFRKKMNDVFSESYRDMPGSGTGPQPDAKVGDGCIKLWGVTIDAANPVDARVSVVLMKFLRARNLNVQAAQEMMVQTLRWREHFGVVAAMREEFPQEVFGMLGHVYGHDKEGRPVSYNLYGANKDLKAVFGDVQRFIRWRVALMEKCVSLLDFENVDQTLQIHDYEGVSLSSRDNNSKNAAAEATNIFQNHYPEMLAQKFFINVPTMLSWMFWLFKPLLSAKTLAKMSVVGSGHREIKNTLLKVIDAKELPKKYGGNAVGF